MHSSTDSGVVRALIAGIPEPRLRALVAELVVALMHCFASPGSSSEETTSPSSNGRRRRRPSRDRARAQWSQARRDAENAKARERRALARGERAGNGRKRRGRKPSARTAAGNGAEAAANGRRVPVTAAALWSHAAKLEPKEPWRAVMRELGVAESTAQQRSVTASSPAPRVRRRGS